MRAGMCAPWRAVLVSVAVAAWCGVAAGAEVTELRVEEKQAILDAHNKYRRLAAKGGQGLGHPSAAGIDRMYWDAGLEEMAKKRAAHCFYGHFGGTDAVVEDYKAVLDKVSYGITTPMTPRENIALFRDHQYFSAAADKTGFMQGAVHAWVAEGKLFDWNKNVCYAETCGHWSLVVAESTRYVGCAAAACPNGIMGSNWGSGAVVHCNYWPPVEAGYPYQKSYNDFYAEYCLRCMSTDANHCDDHLCSGGINPLWFSSGYTNDTIAQCDDGLGRTVTPCFPYGKPPITAAPQTAETPAPTSVPATPIPTPVPTSAPTSVPVTPIPTPAPTSAPTTVPATAAPATQIPTSVPTSVPAPIPTPAPTSAPTTVPATPAPATQIPTSVPTSVPATPVPTPAPTTVPATPAPASGKWHTTCPEATQVAAFQSVDAFDQHAPLLFGGNFRVAARVLINRHTSWARVFDFGNGAPRDNVLIAQTSGSGRLSLHVFVNSRSQSITCNTQAPVGRSFDVEASVFNGEAELYVDGVLCAQGQVMAPRAVVRGGNLIGRSHWAQDSLLDGEVSSFVLETCAA